MNKKVEDFIIKVASIIRGENPEFKFGSDKIRNSQAYIQSFAKDNPNLFSILESNQDDLSNISGLHPQRISWIIEEYKRWI